MYKKQLSILNDRLVYDRKKYLIMRQNEINSEQLNEMPDSDINLNVKESKLAKSAKYYRSLSKSVKINF